MTGSRRGGAAAATLARVWRASRRALLASAVLLPGVALADPMFVSDQLVVNVSSEAGGGERVATLKSGDKVELLERQDEVAQVQLANGSRGWVKAAYLTSEAPAQRRLQERIAEIDKLHKDISRLESQLAAQAVGSGTPAGGNTASSIAAKAAGNTGAPIGDAGPASNGAGAAANSGTQVAEEREGTGLMASGDSRSQWPNSAWGWLLGSSVAALVLGFLFGWKTLDRRIREKYGGLRIY